MVLLRMDIILPVIRTVGASIMSSVNHTLDINKKKLIFKESSILAMKLGHISYSQTQPLIDAPIFIQ